MRITDVEPILLRGEHVYGAADGADESSDSGDWQLLVKVTTDEGLVGYSDVETLSPAAAAIIAGPGMSLLGFRALRDLLLGEDPFDAERLWDKLYIGSVYYGRRGVALHCISAIDNCLWSIRALAENVALWQLLGEGSCQRVTAYASTLFRSTPEACAKAARSYVERGFRAVKFGWGVFGQDAGRDVELVAAAREALGPDRDLMIDPGWYGAGWERDHFHVRGREENLALCQRLEPFGVRWIEDFVMPERFDEYAWLRQHVNSPIAAGEQMSTIWDFERLIGEGCVDVVQPDLTRCGGLTVGRQVAALAQREKIDLVPHSWLTDLLTAYSLHLIATLDRPRFVEFNVSQSALTRGVCGGALELNDDGTVTVPDGPGHGVAVDEAFVAAHRVDR